MHSRYRLNKRGKPPEDTIITQYKNFIRNSQRDENGNRFMETIVTMPSGTDWTRINRRRPTLQPRPPEIIDGDGRRTGAPSLHVLARRTLNKHIEEFTIEILRGIPWVIMKPVWEDTLNTWGSLSYLTCYELLTDFLLSFHSSRDSFLVWSRFASIYGVIPSIPLICLSRLSNNSGMLG